MYDNAFDPGLLDATCNPGSMLRFIQAVNANARRYTNPESSLNAGITGEIVGNMLLTTLHKVWIFAVGTHSGGVPMIQASWDGESPQISRHYAQMTLQFFVTGVNHECDEFTATI